MAFAPLGCVGTWLTPRGAGFYGLDICSEAVVGARSVGLVRMVMVGVVFASLYHKGRLKAARTLTKQENRR